MDEATKIRDRQRTQWTAAAVHWIANPEQVANPTRPITEQLVLSSRVAPGMKVLDVACGTGDPAFTLAGIISPGGFVLGLDITEAMVKGAAEWARQHGISNVEFRHIESEEYLGVPDHSFDLCVCRHGWMFMPNALTALQSFARAVKPGGRVTVSTWGSHEDSPAFTLASTIVRRHVHLPTSDKSVPGLFHLPSPDLHHELFAVAGLSDVETVTLDCPVMTAPTKESMWQKTLTMGGPVAKAIAQTDDATRSTIRSDFLEALTPHMDAHDGQVVLTAQALVTTGVTAG